MAGPILADVTASVTELQKKPDGHGSLWEWRRSRNSKSKRAGILLCASW